MSKTAPQSNKRRKATKTPSELKKARPVAKSVTKRNSQPQKKKQHTILVSNPVNPDIKYIVAAEMADDRMIEDELLGKDVLPYYVYQFQQGDEMVTNLSVKGVFELVRRLNRDRASGYKISMVGMPSIERDVVMNGQKGVQVTVAAKNMLDENSAYGSTFEPYLKKKKGGGTYTDQFALQKALSKAERNAKRKLIPEQVAAKIIEKLLKESNTVMRLEPAPPEIVDVQVVDAPVPTSSESTAKMIVLGITKANTVDALKNIRATVENSTQVEQTEKPALYALIDDKIKQLNKQK